MEGNDSFYINTDGERISLNHWDSMHDICSQSLIGVLKDGKWGYISQEGNILISPFWDEAYPFSQDGLALVCQDNLYGYIDKTGTLITEITWPVAYDFVDGYAIVATENGYGMIDTTGEYIVPPCWTDIQNPAEGMIAVCDSNHLWGFIDMNGQIIIECKYPFADYFCDDCVCVWNADDNALLFQHISGHSLELPIKLAAFYGLRRSEILGLKWDAIDFNTNTISIRHTVTACNLDGKHIEVVANTTKNKSSTRTLPLVPAFQELLLQKKEEQSLCRKLCGNAYCKDYLGYICVNELGERLKPNTLSAGFKRILEENGLRIIRFHDLRHSCASLLLANGVSLKHIQEWLGHSDFSTTANFYAHLDFHSKLSSAEAMQTGLGMNAP